MIELLPTTGCTGEALISKINEIIAVVNSMSNVTSYSQLTDKPSINGVTLVGNKTTAQMQISMAGLSDYSSQMSAIATKTEVQNAQAAATTAATAAVQEQIAGKMDKDPSSTNEVNLMPSDGYVYITTTDGIRKIKFDKLVDNVQYAGEQKSQVQKIVESSGKIRTITGDQDGTNTNFSVTEGYTPGTSMLYFNGQLLTRSVDYIETSNSTFTMLTHIPISTDIMQMVAVPIN